MCAQRLGGGGGAPARRQGARGREGLGGTAGPTEPGGQRRRSCAPVLGNEHLAARRDPGRDSRTMQARRGVGVPLVSRPAERLMPQARLLHLGHDGAQCSKQSAP